MAAADSDDVTRGDLISYSNKDDVQSGLLKSPKTKGKNFFPFCNSTPQPQLFALTMTNFDFSTVVFPIHLGRHQLK